MQSTWVHRNAIICSLLKFPTPPRPTLQNIFFPQFLSIFIFWRDGWMLWCFFFVRRRLVTGKRPPIKKSEKIAYRSYALKSKQWKPFLKGTLILPLYINTWESKTIYENEAWMTNDSKSEQQMTRKCISKWYWEATVIWNCEVVGAVRGRGCDGNMTLTCNTTTLTFHSNFGLHFHETGRQFF